MNMTMQNVKISDLNPALIKGVNFDKADAVMVERNGFTPLLRAHNIKEMKTNSDEMMYVRSSVVKEEQYLQKGDVVFVTSSGSKNLVGKSALISELSSPATIGAFNSLLRFSDDVEPRYVFYSLNSPSFKSHIGSRLAGASINNIKKNDILDFELTVPFKDGKPDLAEQKRIADKLDRVFAEIENGEKVADKNALLSKKLFASYLRSGFEGAEIDEVELGSICSISGGQGHFLTEGAFEMSMETKTLANVPLSTIATLQSGFAFKSTDYAENGYSLMRIANVQSGYIDDTNRVYVPDEIALAKPQFILNEGDMLVSLTGNVGRVGVIKGKHLPAVLNQRVAKFVLNTEKVLPRYLFYVLNSRTFEEQCIANGKGAAQKNISNEEVLAIEVPLPLKNSESDIEEQKRIADKLDKVFAEIENGENVADKNALLSKKLFASYLHSGFEGAEIDEVELGSICSISGGFGFPHAYQGRKTEKYPFYKVSDMNTSGNEVYMKSHNHSVSDEDVKKLKLKIYPAGTIIFPKIGAAIATNKKRILSVPSTVDNNVMVLVPNKGVSSEYLYNYLLNFDLRDWSNKAALPSIRKSDVEKTIVPLPMKNGEPDYGAQETFANAMKVFQEKAVLLERLSRANVQKLQGFRHSVLSHLPH